MKLRGEEVRTKQQSDSERIDPFFHALSFKVYVCIGHDGFETTGGGGFPRQLRVCVRYISQSFEQKRCHPPGVSLSAVHDEWHLLLRFLVGLGGFGSLVSMVLRGVRGRMKLRGGGLNKTTK